MSRISLREIEKAEKLDHEINHDQESENEWYDDTPMDEPEPFDEWDYIDRANTQFLIDNHPM